MGKTQLDTLWPATIGFDRFIHDVERMLNQSDTRQGSSTFPPHNIIKLEDHKYAVELAVAGFNKNDITIKTVDGILEIKGQKSNDDKDTQYLYKGIGTRSFVKRLQLADTVEVLEAFMKDGILTVGLENVIPEHKKPRIISISDDDEIFEEKKLLQE